MINYQGVERNDLCPCLSGKKFKVCCQAAYNKCLRVIREKDARIKRLLIEVLKERELVRAGNSRIVKENGRVIIHCLDKIPAVKVDYGVLPLSLSSPQDLEIVSGVNVDKISMEKIYAPTFIPEKENS